MAKTFEKESSIVVFEVAMGQPPMGGTRMAVIRFSLAVIMLLTLLGKDLRAEEGPLIHIAVPYAKFVTGAGDGLDVDLVKAFASSQSRPYSIFYSTWADWIADLTGKQVEITKDGYAIKEEKSPKGHLAGHGITVLEWRKELVDFSVPTFPTQVWVVARAESAITPVKASGNMARDISMTKALLKGRAVLGIKNLCVDPVLYGLDKEGALCVYFDGTLNDIVPAVLKGKAELALLDAPDAMIALSKWPGRIKVIGPVSEVQDMAIAFDKKSKELKERFNSFFVQFYKSGKYLELVKDYYPIVLKYFGSFFEKEIDIGQ